MSEPICTRDSKRQPSWQMKERGEPHRYRPNGYVSYLAHALRAAAKVAQECQLVRAEVPTYSKRCRPARIPPVEGIVPHERVEVDPTAVDCQVPGYLLRVEILLHRLVRLLHGQGEQGAPGPVIRGTSGSPRIRLLNSVGGSSVGSPRANWIAAGREMSEHGRMRLNSGVTWCS